MSSWGRSFYTLTARERPTVGDTKFSAVNLDHMGWLLCDGRNVPVKDYYFLYQVIGYSFGSNTRNDFNLPNMSGRIPGALGSAGSGNNYSGSNWALGQSTGTEYHTLTVAEMPTHNHHVSTFVSTTGITVNDPGHQHTGTTDISGSHAHNYKDVCTVENGGSGGTWPGASDNDNNTFYYRKTDGNITTDANDPLTNIPTSSSGAHTHTFTANSSTTGITLTDPGHIHRIPDDGGSNRHNNMQPTTFIGNMFIYSGMTNYASFNFPYKPRTNLY